MAINFKEFIVQQLRHSHISNVSSVNANHIIKIDKSAVESYRKQMMEEIFDDGYQAIYHLQEAMEKVNSQINDLVPPHFESTGYTTDENGCKVPNAPVWVDPDAATRNRLEGILEELSFKYSEASDIVDRLNFLSLIDRELSNINYSLDKANYVISRYVYKMNNEIAKMNSEKTKYVEHAIRVMSEFEMTRGQYQNRNTTRLMKISLANHRGHYSSVFHPTSRSKVNGIERKIQEDKKGNLYIEYYQNDNFIIEIVSFINIEELKNKISNANFKKPILYIKQTEILKLMTIKEFESIMSNLNYEIKKDNMGFYKKTIQGHIVFIQLKENGI